MADSRLEYLFYQWFNKTATQEEKNELMILLSDAGKEDQVKQLMTEAWNEYTEEPDIFSAGQTGEMITKIIGTGPASAPVHDISYKRKSRPWLRAAAAAAILLMMGSGTFLMFMNNRKDTTVQKHQSVKATTEQIHPGGDKAFLTLSDGTIIILDSAKNGTLSKQGSTRILKIDGRLVYDADNVKAGENTVYNTISTPRGGEYQVMLPDGTRVWLNAASSLHFPIIFSGKERHVDLTGEAYFEVAKNARQPFTVTMNNGMRIEVLGTHFNVMAYEDEADIKTTLVEGSVKVSRDGNSVHLKPLQQAVLNKNNSHLMVADADVEEELAWKEGLFNFNNDDIASIMRQLSRWYDVEVKFSGPLPHGHYAGTIRRQAQIAQVLKLLELPGGIQFAIQGKNVIVTAIN
jgi:transmembrane sensor